MAAKAEVQYDPGQVLPQQVASSITELGFPTTVLEEDGAGQGDVDLEVPCPLNIFGNDIFTSYDLCCNINWASSCAV